VHRNGLGETCRRRNRRPGEKWSPSNEEATCIVDAKPVIHGVSKVAFDDRYEGVVDLRPLIAKGKVFAWLRAPEHFAAVRVDEFGRSTSWIDSEGYAIDLSADSIRRDCERQTEIHRLMSAEANESQRA
jgi:hypothetical protein